MASRLSEYAKEKGFASEVEALKHAIRIGKTYDGITKEIGYKSANSVRQACIANKLDFERVETVIIRELA